MPKNLSWMLWGYRVLSFISVTLQSAAVTGHDNNYSSLHPVHPSYPPRRQSAQTEPALNISLYYAETGYENVSGHAAIITWNMRYPTIVTSDNADIKSIHCDADGIHLDFASPIAKLQAQKWQFPLVIVLEGETGGCTPVEPSQEKYYPFYAESEQQSIVSEPETIILSGFRSRWDIVAHDHEIQVVQCAAGGKTETEKSYVDRRRGLQTPLKWQISPSLNFDPQNNSCSNCEVPINIAAWEHGSVSMICRNCFVDSRFQLSVYSGSRIILAGINSITKIIRKLYRTEQRLMRFSRSLKKIVVSQFTMLSEQLADAMSAFYSRIYDLTLSTDLEEKNKMKEELRQAALKAEKTSLKLLENVQAQLDIGIALTRTPLRDQLLLVEEIKEITSTTNKELEEALMSGEELVLNELSLPVCSDSQEDNLQHEGACRRRRKETSARLTGHFRANADVEITLTGTGEMTPGDIPVLSVNLAGIQIPGIVSIGPHARLISHTGLVFTGSATLAFGGEAEWQHIDTLIYGKGKKNKILQPNSTNAVFHPHSPRFEINPQQLSLEQHFKPQVTFGIELLLGAQQLLVGIGADIGLVNTFQLPNVFSRKKEYCSDGIKYDFNITSQLEGITSMPSSAIFLLSKVFPTFSDTLKQMSYPLLVSPSLNLVEHCFKLPSILSSQSNRPVGRVLPSGRVGNVSSTEL